MTQPPARYSVNQPDFNSVISRRLEIYLDGQQQTRVIAYDCEEGWVLRQQIGADGHLIVDHRYGWAEGERMTGLVTVNWKTA